MENYEFESFIKDIVLNREVDNMLLEKIKIILEKCIEYVNNQEI